MLEKEEKEKLQHAVGVIEKYKLFEYDVIKTINDYSLINAIRLEEESEISNILKYLILLAFEKIEFVHGWVMTSVTYTMKYDANQINVRLYFDEKNNAGLSLYVNPALVNIEIMLNNVITTFGLEDTFALHALDTLFKSFTDEEISYIYLTKNKDFYEMTEDFRKTLNDKIKINKQLLI